MPHYWQSLPAESPLKAKYAPPARPTVSYWAALAAVAVGVVVLTGGSVLLGLLLIAGGVSWGAVVHRAVQAAEVERAEWESSHVCLACTGTF